jgi:hypothetical protein
VSRPAGGVASGSSAVELEALRLRRPDPPDGGSARRELSAGSPEDAVRLRFDGGWSARRRAVRADRCSPSSARRFPVASSIRTWLTAM